MKATLTRKTSFELGKWYKVKAPVPTENRHGLPVYAHSPSQLKWTSEMDQHDGKIFQCKRIFFGGKHAALASHGMSCGMHIDWVDGPFASELLAKREEVADKIRATVMPNGDGWIEKNLDLEPIPDVGGKWNSRLQKTKTDTAKDAAAKGISIMGRAWRKKTEKMINGREVVNPYVNGIYTGHDTGGSSKFRNERTGEITTAPLTRSWGNTNKDKNMPTGDFSHLPKKPFGDTFGELPKWAESVWDEKYKEAKAAIPTVGTHIPLVSNMHSHVIGPITTTTGITVSGTTEEEASKPKHPDEQRALDESVVVNGLFFPDGYNDSYELDSGDDIWFPADRPDALGLTGIKGELESLIKEGHRILDEVEGATQKEEEEEEEETEPSLQESLDDIDKKYNDEINRVWKNYHKRQNLRTAVNERTMSELKQDTAPKTKSYRWVRWAAGLLSLATVAGSAIHFLL